MQPPHHNPRLAARLGVAMGQPPGRLARVHPQGTVAVGEPVRGSGKVQASPPRRVLSRSVIAS